MTNVQGVDLKQLRKNIDAAFDLGELNTLLFDLEIDPEKIPGTQKEEKIVELIRYCQRRGPLLFDLITSCEASRPHLQWRQQVPAQASSLATRDARIQHRRELYTGANDLQLVHTLLPSGKGEKYWDILIYLIRHQSDDLSLVSRAEFFLGRYWDNKIFSVPNQDNFIGITISAYGPTLCTCRVVFTDGNEAMLNRYIDFEMTSLFARANPDKQATTAAEPEIIVIDTSDLIERIGRNFDGDEMEMLAFDLGMEWPGTGDRATAIELVRHMQRLRRLPELLALCRQTRPHEQWG